MWLWRLLLACEREEEPAPVDCSGYDWDTVGAPFVYTWCTPCHAEGASDRSGAPPGVDFDTLEGVLAWLDEVEQRAVIDRDMPPMGGPFDADVDAFAIWLACGAP